MASAIGNSLLMSLDHSEPQIPVRTNEGIVCGKSPFGGGIVDCVCFDGGMRGRFDPIPRRRNCSKYAKSFGGALYDPDGVSRADDGGVWSHDLIRKKHRVVSSK